MKVNNLSTKLDGVYKLVADAYSGNWKLRWGGTPYFDFQKTGKTESVVGHEWGCGFFWLTLRRVCPALSSLVDSTRVYEILLSHDLGETRLGDVSRFQQLQGQGVNKQQSERDAISTMTQVLDPNTRDEILAWFDEFEKKPEEMSNLEVLVAKFVDSLQGDHFVLVFGHDLSNYSAPISKIVNKHFVPYATRLMEVLKEQRHTEALEEVKRIFKHHIELIQTSGIKLDTSSYPV